MTAGSGKVCLITGSTRGIGKAIAWRLAEKGIIPVITGRNGSDAQAVAAEIKAKTDVNAKGIALDVADLENCTQVIESLTAEFGAVDYLVNNAGITRDMLFIRMKESEWDDVISINLKGVFNCCRSIIKSMLKNKSGKIVNITSLVGVSGNAGQVNYSASKAGVIGFTKSLALEYAKKGITVNAVAPGYIQTDMTSELPDKVKEEVLEQIPAGRFGKPEEIAYCVDFLLSDAADYITGQVIHVNGGMLMP